MTSIVFLLLPFFLLGSNLTHNSVIPPSTARFLSSLFLDAVGQHRLFVEAPGSPIAIAGGPGNVAIADLNGDGKPDLLVACGQSRTIAVLVGRGNGQFDMTQKSPFPVPCSPSEMALADLDNDGTIDLAFGDHGSYGVTVMLGDGKGGFAPAPYSPVVMRDGKKPHTHGLELGDLNGDGKLDIVTVNNNDNDVSVALADRHGRFTRAAGSPFAVGQSPYPAALGDLNGDGHLDIVATTTMTGPNVYRTATSSSALSVLFGDGQGGFRRAQVQLRTREPWCVDIGDLNADNKPDIVATHRESSPLTIMLGDGSGGFKEGTGSPFDLGHSAWRVVIVDADCDGKADVIAAADNGVRVMLGDGRGAFTQAPVRHSAPAKVLGDSLSATSTVTGSWTS